MSNSYIENNDGKTLFAVWEFSQDSWISSKMPFDTVTLKGRGTFIINGKIISANNEKAYFQAIVTVK
jgi:hypothetical protein